MARAVDVLRRLVRLAEMGKLPDAKINGVLNGATVTTQDGVFEYRDGNLRAGGQVTSLSPDRILDISWCDKPEKKNLTKKSDAKS